MPRLRLTLSLLAASVATNLSAQETELLWGDLHLHSSYSTDAWTTGNRSVTPDLAYRYARGLPITHPTTGAKIEISQPLDFLALTDHAENTGVDTLVERADELLSSTEGGQALLDLVANSPNWRGVMGGLRGAGPGLETIRRDIGTDLVKSSIWSEEIAAAEANYRPGEFTTLIAWEWTAMGEGGRNLHRCIITNADGTSGNTFIPLNNSDTQIPEELYAWLRETIERTGVEIISIQHNSNISGG